MARRTRAFYWLLTLTTEAVFFVSCLVTGVVVGAVTERLCRRLHPRARIRNIITKAAVACVSVSFLLQKCTTGAILTIQGDYASCETGLWMFISMAMRVIAFVSGTIVGTAFQPVGLTGGIATGKSTVATLLQAALTRRIARLGCHLFSTGKRSSQSRARHRQRRGRPSAGCHPRKSIRHPCRSSICDASPTPRPAVAAAAAGERRRERIACREGSSAACETAHAHAGRPRPAATAARPAARPAVGPRCACAGQKRRRCLLRVRLLGAQSPMRGPCP